MKNKIESILKNKFFKNMTYVFSGSMIGSVLSLFNTGLLIKEIGLEKNGIIFLGLGYASFFSELFNFQLYEAVIKFLPSCMDYGNKEGKNYIQQVIILDICTAVFAFFCSYFMVGIVGEYFEWDLEVKKYIKILTVTALFSSTGSFRGVLRIFEKFKAISWINILTNAINTVLYLIGFIFKLKILYYVYASVISFFLLNLLIFFLFRKTLKENGMADLNFRETKFQKDFIKFAIYTNLSSTVNLPVSQITPFIINKYLGFSEIAIYKILEKLGGIIKKVTGTITQVFSPEISKRLSFGDTEGVYRIGFRIGQIVLGVGIAGIVGVSLTYRYWLGYLIPGYENYMVAVYLYLILTIFTEAFSTQYLIFIYSGYVKENTLLLIVVNIIYFIILIIFTKLFGINGIILSLIIQGALVFTIRGFILKKHA
ncbi:MAG: lipopolysaccharide biosynthesis protein [Fusobacteriaceae bacterium]